VSVQSSVRSAVVAAALLAATVGCGAGGQESASGPPVPTAAPTAGPEPTSAPEPTAAPQPGTATPAAPAPGGQSVPLLEGAVGTTQDPEAFEIVLTDSSGVPVESLPAGDYDVRVQDPATLHNFHLTGPGVDMTTPITGTGEVVWRVTLTPGEYTAVCDPHPSMVTSFTVG